MIQKTDTGVAHPHAMVVDPQRALITCVTVLSPRWHDLLACLAVREFANLRQVHDHTTTRFCVTLRLEMRRRVQLKQLHVHLDAVGELIDCAVRASGDVLSDSLVHALEQILTLINVPWDLFEFLELFRQQQLIL